jgi:hypothetical protein
MDQTALMPSMRLEIYRMLDEYRFESCPVLGWRLSFPEFIFLERFFSSSQPNDIAAQSIVLVFR